MIHAKIHRNDQVLMHRTFDEPSLSLEQVLKYLELYVINEQLNVSGECRIRVRFNTTPVP